MAARKQNFFTRSPLLEKQPPPTGAIIASA
jgi:hypothetical protein